MKIPKGYSESVNRRRTDNTMAKREKRQKDKKGSIKHTHKTKDQVKGTTLITGGILYIQNIKPSHHVGNRW